MNVIYFGYNSFKKFKRGVENVIIFQSLALNFKYRVYIHWGDKNEVYKYNNFICISIKNSIFWPIYLNFIVFKIKNRFKNKTIIHSHSPIFSFFSLKRTNILTVHDGLYYQSKFLKNKFSNLFYLIEKSIYLRISNIHFISEYSKKMSLCNRSKNTHIIYNSSHLESLVSSKDFQSKKEYILVVKSIEERSRFDLIVQLAKKIDILNLKIKVAGKGPLLNYYKDIIKKNNIKNLKFLGYVDDKEIIDLYRDSTVVLNIADYGEGFGLPIIESYLFNKPVIASNTCAIPEIILNDFFLIENNVNQLFEKIIELKNNNFYNYRKHYDKNFSNTVILEKFKKLYSIFNR